MAEDHPNSKVTVLSALIFALVGICVGMIFGHSESDRTRVPLEVGVPLSFCGYIAGSIVGYFLDRWTIGSPRLRRNAETALAVVLAGAVFAPIGWLTRDPWQDPAGHQDIFLFFGAGVIFAILITIFRNILDEDTTIRVDAEASNRPE